MTTLDPTTIALIAGVIIPVITATVTKARASAVFKTVVTALLSASAVGLAAIVGPAGSAVISQESLAVFGKAFVVAIVSYKSLWKSVGINDKMLPHSGFGLPS